MQDILRTWAEIDLNALVSNFNQIKSIMNSGNKTIVFWNDKTKTIVSCGEGEQWDPYTGFCAALAKKLYGSTSHTKKMLKKVSVDKRAVAEKIDP